MLGLGGAGVRTLMWAGQGEEWCLQGSAVCRHLGFVHACMAAAAHPGPSVAAVRL